ncbi:NAD+ synthase [Lacisediminihabitans changchengi]|uniref:Glutamine-dependent NAD(+) synthetase n=1 Tax=Lacisediminihabitans changchengi TaxID=2787634 RepID=A0A934SPP8_9MICO|nr:NAD+ synthase [Lacisediminihabitans changchengi]MBK4346700.1 NAD+ synthase [Lacisediminihabitans changchengi]MBK4348177.1 NAD+ synthase [Lacisediminihabitans changchengi]
MPRLRLALGQTNPIIGDLEGNSAQILNAAREAAAAGADLFAVGEMAISGYPIEDLASRPSFLAECHDAVDLLARQLQHAGLGELPVVVGHPDGPFEPRLLGTSSAPTAIAKNRASVLQHGAVQARYTKHHLPNYSVFDEYRVFIPGDELLVLRIKGVDVALIVCEDLWRDGGPLARVLDADAGLLLVINASPFERDKDDVRLPLVTRRAIESDTIVAYVNIVGGQDDLVFDGDSVIVDTSGEIVARAPQFREYLLVADLDVEPATAAELPKNVRWVSLDAPSADPSFLQSDIAVPPDDREQIWNALVLGLRDYVTKNGFPSVVLGVSGGIDSSVVAAIAADAIGADRVYGIAMPSRYSSGGSVDDASELAERIGFHYSVQPIADLVAPIEEQLQLTGVAAENVQARIRGMIWMAESNMHGHLALTNGNKTEISVGYSTIYGDAAGGFAPIKDVPKTLVWELARWRNEYAASRGETPPIPANSIEKPPSAELRPDQTDQDTLPPYDILDGILDGYIAKKLGRADVVNLGYDPETVDFVTRLVDRAEWKRRQGAIGPKISGMAFGRDRRLPITYRPNNAPLPGAATTA